MIIISGTVGVKIVGNNQHQPDLLLLASKYFCLSSNKLSGLSWLTQEISEMSG